MPWAMQSGSARSARSPGDHDSAWQLTMAVMVQSVLLLTCLGSPRVERRAGISCSQGAGPAASMPCSKVPCQYDSAACMSRRAKQERRQPRRQPQQLQLQEKAQAAGVCVRSRASAARRDAPKATEEPEYKKVYKPRVRFDTQWQCGPHAWHACLATIGRSDGG